jgi:hypothetical protein
VIIHGAIIISGGTARAINSLVNDAQDGVISRQNNACTQFATAGNLLQLSGVAVSIYR